MCNNLKATGCWCGNASSSPREYDLIQMLQVILGTRCSSCYQITIHLCTLCSISGLKPASPALQEEVNSLRTGTWKNPFSSNHSAPVQQLSAVCLFIFLTKKISSQQPVMWQLILALELNAKKKQQPKNKCGSVSSAAVNLQLFVLSWLGPAVLHSAVMKHLHKRVTESEDQTPTSLSVGEKANQKRQKL